jgi:para-nitrobenzyl esterase
MSENCLYLNVYRPEHSQSNAGNLPVMVWIHGGVLVWGESNDYDPAQLVAHGVIVVTMNYRLGALGFLAHPALADQSDGPSGNYGLMDQQAALRWVQGNIGRFGGDPRKVTLFGESAGGLSVLSQLASPGARGLFARAIVESGTYTLTPVSLATAEAAGETFAASAGCPDQSASCLRSLQVSTILKYQDAGGYRPNIDGQVLSESLQSAFASGDFNHVPVIIGTNHDERRLFVAIDQLVGDPVTAGNYESMIQSSLDVSPATAAEVVAKYPLSSYASPALALAAVGTDDSFACFAITADQSLSKYVRTYSYEFNDENAPERYEPPVGFPYGAAHESELQYLFQLSNTPYPGVLSAGQRALAATMRSYWTNFAKDGIPSSADVPGWKPFTGAGHQTMSLDTPRPHVETTFASQHNCVFWDSIS